MNHYMFTLSIECLFVDDLVTVVIHKVSSHSGRGYAYLRDEEWNN